MGIGETIVLCFGIVGAVIAFVVIYTWLVENHEWVIYASVALVFLVGLVLWALGV